MRSYYLELAISVIAFLCPFIICATISLISAERSGCVYFFMMSLGKPEVVEKSDTHSCTS